MLTAGQNPAQDPDRSPPIRFERPTPADGAAIWELVATTTLDLNSPYAYVLWGDHFAATSCLARDDRGLVGFVMGHRVPARPDTLFVWQVGVTERARGTGLASRLLDEVWSGQPDVRHLEATVTPSNTASDRLFRSFGARHDAPVHVEPAYDEAHFPGQGHEAEILYRIGPVRRGAP
ncbi:MAG: diaminobutyrate acetyltransferase [Acidimicrobiales bacterium]|nr:diaminobutyrate acetyltransferase [Acidimicrobiales bacterium]